MTTQEIQIRKEDQTFDSKSIQVEPKALAIPIVAFANADGSVIVVGVSDKKRKIEGIDNMCRELEVNGSIVPTFHADDFILKVTVSKVTENINRVTEKLPVNIENLTEKLPENHLGIIEVSAAREENVVDYLDWATRELLMNAICHRDYCSNGPIQFYQYDDRIEIMNHGGLYGRANEKTSPT